MRRTPTLVALLAVTLAAGLARAADNYNVDSEHASIIFRIDHLGVGNAYGRFNDPTGKLTLDNGKLTDISFEVKTENVDTDNQKRDDHLRSPDFFNAKQFPVITFKSTGIKAAGDNQYEVTGDLTLHGVTKSITVPLKKTGEKDTGRMGYRTGWEAQLDLKRSDYGMTGMQGAVGDDVHLVVSFEAVKQ